MSCQFLTSLQPLEVTAIGKVFVPGLENVSVAHAPSVVTTAPTQDMVNDGSNHHHMTEYLKSAFNEGNIEGMCHAGLRAGMITPRLAHQLSHKLSIKFGNPTVVHRPSLRVRPSVRSVQDESRLPSANSLQDISLPESTNPSGCNDSGSISSSIQSTGETSLDFNAVSCHLSRTKEQNERYYVHRRGVTPNSKLCDKLQLPIQESPLAIIPTIVTVETTANAKIFFETHFNSILSNELSPRAQRRNDLELSLRKAELSAEQCQRKRVDWATKESEYLRRSRVLRSKMNEMKGNTGVAVAGYEVVRILGKGSFGVVRLVRHKDSKGERNFPQSHTLNLPRSFTCFPHEEPKNIKMAAIKAFDPAFDPTINNSKGSQDHHPQNITGEVFAMKVIRKSEMLRNAQEGHLRAERDFLVASERSRWVVPLVASFQDTKNLYLVMEYMVGGDFLALLFRKDTLKEKTARWYIAEMILCVEEAHKLQWIHRDVKPDNFLISASGHLKISDFGLAFDGHWSHDQSYFNNHRRSLLEKLGVKVGGDSIDRKEGKSIATGMTIANILTEHKEQNLKPQLDSPDGNERILQWRNRIGKRKLARSVVGTSQYMAPEIIRGELYDGRCDWWSIGIILYEVRLPYFLTQTLTNLYDLVHIWLHTFCK